MNSTHPSPLLVRPCATSFSDPHTTTLKVSSASSRTPTRVQRASPSPHQKQRQRQQRRPRGKAGSGSVCFNAWKMPNRRLLMIIAQRLQQPSSPSATFFGSITVPSEIHFHLPKMNNVRQRSSPPRVEMCYRNCCYCSTLPPLSCLLKTLRRRHQVLAALKSLVPVAPARSSYEAKAEMQCKVAPHCGM